MDRRTSENAKHLDGRYRRGVRQGRYFAHEPIYGVGCCYSEPQQAVKLARTYGIFRRLAQMQFGTLLDVGGAEGYHASLARRIFSTQVVSSDLSFEADLRARELFGLPAVAGDAHWLPYPDGSFDVVLCCEVLEHVSDPVAVMCEVMRVAGRYAVFSTEQTARHARERELRLLLADTESPHSELHWFLPDDFRTVLGDGVTHEREVVITKRLAALYAVGLEPPPAEIRDVVLEMTRVGDPTPSDNGILVVKAKGGAPPLDTSEPGGEALLDTLMAYKVAPGGSAAQPPSDALDPFLRGKLVCPACLCSLDEGPGTLRCTDCGREFPVDRGIPRLGLDEASVGEVRAGRSRWPWLTDEAAELRGMFTAPRPVQSRLFYYLLSAELSLLDVIGEQRAARDEYASSGELRRALRQAVAGREGGGDEPRAELAWWERLPATAAEVHAMSRLGANLAGLLADLAAARASAAQPRTLGGVVRAGARRLSRAARRLVRSVLAAHRGVRSHGGPFRDIPPDFWALAEINALARAGISGDSPDRLYHPEWTVSRGDMAIYIARAVAGGDAGVPERRGGPSFPDIPTTDPVRKHVEYAVARGIVSGYSDGLYHPEHFLDRGQIAVFVARAMAGGDADTPDGPPTPTFPDVTPQRDDPYAECYRYIEYLAAHGVVRGYPDGLYHPERACSRDQMAVYLARAFGLTA